MKKIFYLLICLGFSIYGHSQYRKITGIIKDSLTGRPLQGASVRTLNGEGCTISDGQGRFYLRVAPNDTLLATVVGYHKGLFLINKGNSSPLTLLLHPSDSTLQDVIVNTGYQSIPKERATGSFVQINNQLINRSVGPNILDRLKGVTSSLLFDEGPSHPPITIRGIGTLSKAITSPLIIIDNFPYEGDISNINPNDVENITILRDAAAASIWGAKAGNGVIVITTKKAKRNQPMHLTVSSNYSLKAKPDLFGQSQISTEGSIEVVKMLFDNGFYDAKLKDTRTYPVISPVVRILDKNRRGDLSDEAADAMLGDLAKIDVRNGYLKYFYRPEATQQYSINLSGGKDKIAYMSSIGYDKQLSTEIGNKNDRITWRSNIVLQSLAKLQIQASSMVTWTRRSVNSQVPYDLGTGGSLYPYTKFADENGKALPIEQDMASSFKDTAGNGMLLNWDYVPLDELKYSDNTSASMDILLNTQATYTFLPVLKGEVTYQYEHQNLTGRTYHSPLTYYTRNLINLYSVIDGNKISYGLPVGGILDKSFSEATTHNVRGQVDYDQYLSKHHINAVFGGEIRETSSIGSSPATTYGYNENNLTFVNVNFAERYPVLDGLNYSGIIRNNASFTNKLDRVVSIYANASYSYDNRYTFSGSARRDASNIFGVSTNNKWKPLWSIGGAWTVSNEKFYKLSQMPFLKLRFTYGFSGNVNNSISALTTLSYSSSNFTQLSVLPFAQVLNPPNPDLSWEQVRTVNAAVDFSSKNNRLSGSIEYYSKKSTNVLSSVPADITTGVSSFKKNSADLQGHGLDLTLNANIINRNFIWNSNFLLSYNKVVVTATKEGITPRTLASSGGGLIEPVVGQSPYSIASFKWGGLNPQNGNPIGYLNGEPSEDYRSIITKTGWDDIIINGSAVPELYGGLRNTFRYKQVAFSFNITYKMLYYFRKNALNYSSLFNSGFGTGDYANRWQTPGDEKTTNVPSMIYPANSQRDLFYGQSSINIVSGDQIRLQDIRLSYDFTPRTTFQTIELFVYASNLGLLWRKNQDHLDPDAYKTYPQPATWSLGCKINF